MPSLALHARSRTLWARVLARSEAHPQALPPPRLRALLLPHPTVVTLPSPAAVSLQNHPSTRDPQSPRLLSTRVVSLPQAHPLFLSPSLLPSPKRLLLLPLLSPPPPHRQLLLKSPTTLLPQMESALLAPTTELLFASAARSSPSTSTCGRTPTTTRLSPAFRTMTCDAM